MTNIIKKLQEEIKCIKRKLALLINAIPITKTSQLINDGADNTSTYVEHDELLPNTNFYAEWVNVSLPIGTTTFNITNGTATITNCVATTTAISKANLAGGVSVVIAGKLEIILVEELSNTQFKVTTNIATIATVTSHFVGL